MLPLRSPFEMGKHIEPETLTSLEEVLDIENERETIIRSRFSMGVPVNATACREKIACAVWSSDFDRLSLIKNNC